jgi:hypothetical protein
MALKFNFRKERIVLDEKFFMFKEFVDIWKSDKTKNKSKANAMLRFVFLLSDITEDNPIRDETSEKKEQEAKFRAFKDTNKKFSKKEYDYLTRAVKKYVELNTTPEELLLNVFDAYAENLSDILESQVPETETNEENGVVTYVSNSKIISDALFKLSELRKGRETLLASIKKEAISSRVRGQLKLSPLVRGEINLPRQ